jgi:hypothetical protein
VKPLLFARCCCAKWRGTGEAVRNDLKQRLNMTTTVTAAQRQHGGMLVRAGIGAAMMTALANAVLYLAAVQAGIFPALRPDPAAGPQMAVELVVLSSLVGVAAGMGVFALVRRYTSDPLRTFHRIAGVVLLVSFAAPFTLPGTWMQAMVLNVMHVIAAVFVVRAVRRA